MPLHGLDGTLVPLIYLKMPIFCSTLGMQFLFCMTLAAALATPLLLLLQAKEFTVRNDGNNFSNILNASIQKFHGFSLKHNAWHIFMQISCS